MLNTRFGDDDRLDVQTRHELDVVHGEDVGGIDHGQSERGANSGQRQDRILLRYFLRDEAEHRGIDLKEFEIDGRDPVLAGENSRYHVVRHEAELDEVKAQPTSVFALVFKRFTQVLRANQIFTDKDFA